ncbi:hypothetical protein B0H34DRAFT_720962 [Crassisporium funariophilum]|nr:hypothetical protein B0H34DRAFT_720962 [Crassisporium funariophilum]
MAPTAPANHDPNLSHPTTAATSSQPSQAPGGIPTNLTAADLSNMHLTGLDQNQIMNLLRSLPGIYNKLTEQGQGNPKEDAAQTLSNLAQAPPPFGTQHLYAPSAGGLPGINDPGPSSHPRGPPNLGQLSAVAMQATPVSVQQQQQQQQPRQEDGSADQGQNSNHGSPGKDAGSSSPTATPGGTGNTSSGNRRGGRSATMGSDEWSRQRKDNHKEVERRRRGNINEGINELGRIVPNGSGEKAKGAILSRAVQYIHHLKENEARNIEKWTLEKLLMDQAMGDLQAQLEEVKRMWEEERMARTRLETELEVSRSMNGIGGNVAKEESTAGTKRRSVEVDGNGEAIVGGDDRDGKRQRTD